MYQETIDSLPAILGGRQAFDEMRYIVRPPRPPLDLLMEGIQRIYERGMFSNQGPEVLAFEEELAPFFEVPHCAVFNNGTIALLILLKALHLSGEVILPSFTFAATAHAVVWAGLTPKFVDIEPDHLTIDPSRVEEALTDNTCAIMGVPTFGNPCDNERLAAIAEAEDVTLIFDSAQAVGSRYHAKRLGGFGTGEMFSLHATKILQTMEGGAVTTTDSSLYEKVCRLRNFGFYRGPNCTEAGLNGKMAEINALFGRLLLPTIETAISNRQKTAKLFRELLGDIPGIRFQTIREDCESNYQFFPVILDPQHFGLSADGLFEALLAEQISCRRYFYPPLHRHTVYLESDIKQSEPLEVTTSVSNNVLCLPIYSDMQDWEVERICLAIERIHAFAPRIRPVLRMQRQIAP